MREEVNTMTESSIQIGTGGGMLPTRSKFRRAALRVALPVVVAFASLSAFAQEEVATGPTDVAELEAWLDGAMAAHLRAHRSAGAVVSVVKDGEVFFSKGYGYADYAGRKKVDPERTLFRIASISKLFVWTSVMQLVEQGKIDLNADVNTYLEGVKVPEKYGQPITMANLMTHTPGFDDNVIGLFGLRDGELPSLFEVIQAEMPKRVRRPGTFASYSNHGTGIAALIVEQVSGVPWEQYIQENVLDPLGMKQISFSMPIPEPLVFDLSQGYRYRNGVYAPQDYEYMPLGPVGCAGASGEAMAKFMIAHLQLGQLGDARILEESTAELMQTELHRMAPGVNAMAHGFIEYTRNGQRTIGHGGDTLWFHSQLTLFPEHDLGIFMSFNTESGAAARGQLTDQFIDHYFPPTDEPAPAFNSTGNVGRFTGSYRSNRYSFTNFTKIGALLNTIVVTDSGDGALHLSNHGKARWVEIAPMMFNKEFDPATVVFIEDERGRITHMLNTGVPVIAFDRDGPLDSPRTHRTILLVSLAFFAWTVIIWPVGAITRWRHDVLVSSQAHFPLPARALSWGSCVLFMMFGVGLARTMQDPIMVTLGVSETLKWLLWLPLAALIFTLGSVGYTVVVWRNGEGKIVSRLYYTALTLVSLTFLWQLFYWRLLGHWYG